ncbi:hypothetical protein [Endozoicomonas sp. Mp262]|uniref:hypothetical protein n=1 Tax=Endozoicomonas sp. Mp262 TaxID=2919499 RepID=UPI0021D97EFE
MILKKASVDAYSGVIIVPGVGPDTLLIRDYDCNSITECKIGFVPQEGSSIYMTPNYRQLLHIQGEVFHVWGNHRLRRRLYLWEYEYGGKLFGLKFRNKPIKCSTVSENKDRVALSLDDGQVLIFQRNISNAGWSTTGHLCGTMPDNPVASFRHPGEGKINFAKFGHKDQHLPTLQQHIEASKSTAYIWRRQHKHELNPIKGNPGGKILYPVEEYPWLTDTSTVLNFDVPMLQAALSPCGRYVVTVSTAELQIWRVPQE